MPSLLDVLVPPACSGCGRLGDVLCSHCRDRFRPASDDRDRFLAPDPGIALGDTLVLAVAAFAHHGPLRKALERLKYADASRVADPIARAALPALRRLLSITGPATLVPVPIHPARLRQRGYNQAALIATALGNATRLPLVEAIVRARETTKQHRLDRAARLRNLRDAFAMAPRARLTGGIIVVDDILTTSATLEACAHVLGESGHGPVYGFAVAREI
jgi:ComF family protein